MNHKILSLEEKKEWNEYLSRLQIEQQDIYFTPEYYELYERNGDGKAQCFVFEKDEDVALYPFLINSVNELGYDLDDEYYDIQGAYGYNGVVTSNNKEHFRKAFYQQFKQFCKESSIIAEFTRFSPILCNNQFSYNSLDVIYDRETVFLNLEQFYDDIWSFQYSSNNRNKIRKANKESFNYKIIEKPNDKDIQIFYDCYTNLMKKINADNFYFFDFRYFLNLHELLKNKFVMFFGYSKEGFVTSCLIVFVYKNYAHNHLSCAYENASSYEKNMLYDVAIRYTQKRGVKYYNFGGGRSVEERDSLLRFKKNFSKNILKYSIGKKVHNTMIYNNIINQWKIKNPRSFEKNISKILGYREILTR